MAFVVITGASDGIGRELALTFSKKGFDVGLLARREDKLRETILACGSGKAVFSVLDVTDSAAQRKVLGEWWNQFGGIDIFIANAGLGLNTSDKEDEYTAISSMIRVNILGAVDAIEFLKPKMIARGSGTLAGIGSIAGARGMPKTGGYCLTKAALHSYLEALRMDLRGFGISVCEIAPGYIDTAMTKPNTFHMPFLMPADVAARKMAERILRKKAFSAVPWQFRLVYPLLKNAPERLVEWATKEGI